MAAPARDPDPESTGTMGALPARSSLVTTFSFEPSIQYGVGPGGSDHRGVRRVDVNLGYSDDLGLALERRLGARPAEAYKKMLRVKEQIKTRAGLLLAARAAGLGPDRWGALLDLFE